MEGLNRRGVLAGAGGLGLGALLLPQGPALAEPLNGQNVKTWRDESFAHHQSLTADAHAKGYRTLSLSISGTPADPRYVAVMFKLSPLIDTHQFDKLTGPQLDATMISEKALGYYPFIISATGSGANAVYAAVFSKVPTFAARAMTKAQFDQGNTAAEAGKVILLWAEAYDDGAGGTLYTACATANVSGEAWNCEASDEGLPDLQNRFDATYAGWGRAAHVAPTPSGGHLMMFTDSVIGANSAWGKMNLAQYDAKAAEQTAGGLQPVRVCATGAGPATRYAAIYAGRTDIAPKSFVATTAMTPMPAVDLVMRDYLKANGLRGCSLAVTVGPRLIYASGYSLSEKGYPSISPATPLRLASVSKTFMAAAIWKLIQDKPDKIGLKTKVQDILGLKALDGGPVAAGFEQITVQNLLEMVSGLDQSKVLHSADLAGALNVPLPITRDQMASWAASDAPSGTGTTFSYGNVDYFLLGQIVKALTGQEVEKAMGPLFLDKLGSGVLGARSLLKDQPNGHARHHLRVYDLNEPLPLKPLDTGRSVRSADRPVVPTQYGAYDYEVLTGAGGFSASALQVARLLAGMTVTAGNPVYTADTLKNWIDAAAAATIAHPEGHGFHGFDGVKYMDAAKTLWRGTKGGWMVSHESSASQATDGYGVVLLNNGNIDHTANFDWVTPLANQFGNDLGKWAGVDHWQDFGMQPFVAMKSKKIAGLTRGFGIAPGDPKRWADVHRKTFMEQASRRPRRPLRRR